ncbi:hypothetical protein BKI52_06760 [marine bacterium AO1-C]|nr:hypothetical protein BKI52_06760 [marine bacterium AO1-C]
MTTLHNEIIINAPIENIWSTLTNIGELDQYDPTVKQSQVISADNQGMGAKRKVEMRDGKNWFEEQITTYEPNEALSFELVACSFPVHSLKHTYSFEKIGNQTKVKQVMKYQMKYGFLGKILDKLVVKRQSDKGIKQFFSGLKAHVEHQNMPVG